MRLTFPIDKSGVSNCAFCCFSLFSSGYFPISFSLSSVLIKNLQLAFELVSIISPHKVFEAIISWVRQDVTNRYDYTHQLLEHVRLMLLPSEYLITRVQEESLVKNDSQCKDYLLEALSYHLMPKEKQLLMKNVRARPRTPIGLPKVSKTILFLMDLSL